MLTDTKIFKHIDCQTIHKTNERGMQTQRPLNTERKQLEVSKTHKYFIDFGTSEEVLSVRKDIFSLRTKAKKVEDERNALLSEVEELKHKLSIATRKSKALSEQFESERLNWKTKEGNFAAETKKHSITISELRRKLKQVETPVVQMKIIPKRVNLSQSLERLQPRQENMVTSEDKVPGTNWRAIIGHLSEPEMTTIRKSLEFVGIEGVTEVIGSLLK